MNESFEKRFWEKVDKGASEECWEWTAADTGKGYGLIHYQGGLELSHRMSVRLSGREIPDGKQVNHDCDNPACVNPDHLYVGTQSENIQDAFDRGRKTAPDCGNPKLSEQDAAEIKARGDESNQVLSQEYGVSAASISRIVNGHVWSDVEPIDSL